MAIQFTDDSFEKEVLQSQTAVLVDFWAPWCGPCRILGPVVEELAEQYKNTSIKIGKLNVDENQKTSQKYEVMSIPALILFKNGQPEKRMTGVQDKITLQKLLDQYV